MFRRAFRILVTVAIALVIGLLVFAGVTYYMSRLQPAIYKPYVFDAAKRRQLAQKALDKFAFATQRAQGAWASEARAATGPSPGAEEIVLSEEELNAALQHNFKGALDAYLKDPAIFLEQDRIVLAGTHREMDALLLFHFRPSVDDDGKLRLPLVNSYVGRAPLPRAMLDPKFNELRARLDGHLPGWRNEARMDRTGVVNDALVYATLARFALNALDDKPSDAVAFLPHNDKFLPVRVTTFKVADGALHITLEPMTPAQRTAMFEAVKSPKLALGR